MNVVLSISVIVLAGVCIHILKRLDRLEGKLKDRNADERR